MSEHLQKQLYGIAIYEEEILLQDFTGSGEKRMVVSPEQLMSFFRTGVTFRTFPGLIWMKDDGTRREYLLTLPAGERTILLHQRTKHFSRKLKLPSMVVKAEIGADGRVMNVKIWGFSGKALQPGSYLYELPLPNIAGANVCLGGTERSHGNDIREAVEKVMFDTPFNHHSDRCGKDGLPFLKYHKKYAGRCPLSSLKCIGTGREILEGSR